MFGKLKEAAGGAALEKAVGALTPQLQIHLETVKSLDPTLVRDDEQFTDRVTRPALVALAAVSGGITSLVPKFNERFTQAMLHLRDELFVLDGDRIGLVSDFQERLPTALLNGLKSA